MDNRRIVINLAVPFFLFLVRWFIVFFGQRAFPTILDHDTATFDKGKTLAMLGWDFAGVGLGFYLSAILNGESILSGWSDGADSDPGTSHLKVIFSFLIFAIVYFGAVFVRFCLLENWSNLELVHRGFYGLLAWVLGFVIMGATSHLAGKAGTPPAHVSDQQRQSKGA